MWSVGPGPQTGGFSQEVSRPGWVRESAVRDGCPSAMSGAAWPFPSIGRPRAASACRRHGLTAPWVPGTCLKLVCGQSHASLRCFFPISLPVFRGPPTERGESSLQ